MLCWSRRVPPEPIVERLGKERFYVVHEPKKQWRWDTIREFDIIFLGGQGAIDVHQSFDKELATILKRYVNEGGVLVLSPNGDWATEVWVGHWNSIFGPLFGMEWIGEHQWDTEHSAAGVGLSAYLKGAFWTTNIVRDHPATEGVNRVYYGAIGLSDGGSPPPLWKELPGWKTLVRGMKTLWHR